MNDIIYESEANINFEDMKLKEYQMIAREICEYIHGFLCAKGVEHHAPGWFERYLL